MVNVTSFAEVWIEITTINDTDDLLIVTSFAEVWIEIQNRQQPAQQLPVTSFAEVWIEISARAVSQRRRAGHFLRGSVD